MIGGLRRLPGEIVYFTLPSLKDQGYHGESLKLISDKYKLLINPTNSKCLGKFHGEPLIASDRVVSDTYHFVRDLFLSRLPKQIVNEKGFIYITRKNCEILNPGNQGRRTRQILNEEEFLPDLRRLGFEILQFEDYSFQKKIEYFQKSKVIVSPMSGGLTFSLFANTTAKIIEIMPANTTEMDHYKIICESLDISFKRFSDVSIVGGPATLGNMRWNMILNKDSFLKWLVPML